MVLALSAKLTMPTKLVARIKNAGKKINENVQRRPLAAGVLSAGTIGVLGDIGAQKMEGSDIDLQRAMAMLAFTAAYSGGFYTFVFRWYEKVFTTANLGYGKFLYLDTCTWAKVAFDNFVHTPFVYFPSYYMTTGVVKGKSLAEIWENTQETYLTNNAASCCLWVPGTMAIFAVVPIHLRVIANNTVNMCWNSIMSKISNGSNSPNTSPTIEPCTDTAEAVPPLLEEPAYYATTAQEQPMAETEQQSMVFMAYADHLPSCSIQLQPECTTAGEDYKAQCAEGLKEAGDRLDAHMRRQWGITGQQWEQVQQYRDAYGSFRQGNAHGCKGESMDRLMEQADTDSTYRQKYSNFRRGAPTGCRTTSWMPVAA